MKKLLLKNWVALSIIYPKYRDKHPRGPEDVACKALHVRSDQITEVAEASADDFPMAAAQVTYCHGTHHHEVYSTETADEILQRIARAEI